MKIETQPKIIAGIFAFLTILGIFLIINSRNNDTELPAGPTTTFVFETEFMPSIELGHYTLWAVNEEGEKLILKRFDHSNVELISLNTEPLIEIVLDGNFEYDSYEISVEPNGDRNEEQSSCILMSGQNIDGVVQFSLPSEFTTASGQFVIATPTDNTSNTNEPSGIWFTDRENGSDSNAGLDLPELTGCWTYGAYVEYRGNYLRVGQFDQVDNADDFSDFSNQIIRGNSIPQVPGEDFLRNLPFNIPAPINLISDDTEVIISLEPRASFTRLSLEYEPFIPILSYQFNGEEETRNPIELQLPKENISLKLEVKFTE